MVGVGEVALGVESLGDGLMVGELLPEYLKRYYVDSAGGIRPFHLSESGSPRSQVQV